jgi:hypothetical protein
MMSMPNVTKSMPFSSASGAVVGATFSDSISTAGHQQAVSRIQVHVCVFYISVGKAKGHGKVDSFKSSSRSWQVCSQKETRDTRPLVEKGASWAVIKDYSS